MRVRIPMLGRKSSLNVATAGGIVVYELLRQYRDQHHEGHVSVQPPRRQESCDAARNDEPSSKNLRNLCNLRMHHSA